MKPVAVLLACLSLASCVNTESTAFQRKSEQKCLAYGYQPGSSQMANCRMQLALLQEQDNMRRKQNMALALNDGADQFNEDQQRQMDRNAYITAHQPRYTMPTQTRCVSSRQFGGNVETICQ